MLNVFSVEISFRLIRLYKRHSWHFSLECLSIIIFLFRYKRIFSTHYTPSACYHNMNLKRHQKKYIDRMEFIKMLCVLISLYLENLLLLHFHRLIVVLIRFHYPMYNQSLIQCFFLRISLRMEFLYLLT